MAKALTTKKESLNAVAEYANLDPLERAIYTESVKTSYEIADHEAKKKIEGAGILRALTAGIYPTDAVIEIAGAKFTLAELAAEISHALENQLRDWHRTQFCTRLIRYANYKLIEAIEAEREAQEKRYR